MNADTDPVILVDADDVAIGTAGKLDAHQRGLRHRAISVLVRNAGGEFLLQRRNPAKYHSGGLWTNACCSHPLPDENTDSAARRRLEQEMGFSCAIEPLFVYHYNDPVPGGLIENEIVHVYGGRHDGARRTQFEQQRGDGEPEPPLLDERVGAAPRREPGRYAIEKLRPGAGLLRKTALASLSDRHWARGLTLSPKKKPAIDSRAFS